MRRKCEYRRRGKKLHAKRTRNIFSSYYTVAFSPKVEIDPVTQKKIINKTCSEALVKWREFETKIVKTFIAEESFGEQFSNCVGCKGNLISFPLIMFTGEGVPLLSDFPLHKWACFLGKEKQRAQYCSQAYVGNKTHYALPKLYKADRYSYCTIKDLEAGIKPPGIESMSDWIMASIYNYGPCVVGFQIYGSFLKFFRGPNKHNIYTAQIFVDDIKSVSGTNKLGGHAAVIVGWGEEREAVGGRMVKHWVMRNSWGKRWADDGFFRVEQNIDFELSRLQNLDTKKDSIFSPRTQFEYEFGAIYFAPYPNPDLYSPGETNDMHSFLQKVPNKKCVVATGPQYSWVEEEMNHDCNCRCGEEYSYDTGHCERATRVAGRGTYVDTLATPECLTPDLPKYKEVEGKKESDDQNRITRSKIERSSTLAFLLLVIILIFVVTTVLWPKGLRDRESNQAPSVDKEWSSVKFRH